MGKVCIGPNREVVNIIKITPQMLLFTKAVSMLLVQIFYRCIKRCDS